MTQYAGQGIWGVVLENREFGIRLLHVEPTEFLEDAIFAARAKIQSLIVDKKVAEHVSRNAALVMYERLPERRPLMPFEYGNIIEGAPQRTPESPPSQTPKQSATDGVATEHSASLLLMLIRDKFATDGERAFLQDMIDRLSLPGIAPDAAGSHYSGDAPKPDEPPMEAKGP